MKYFKHRLQFILSLAETNQRSRKVHLISFSIWNFEYSNLRLTLPSIWALHLRRRHITSLPIHDIFTSKKVNAYIKNGETWYKSQSCCSSKSRYIRIWANMFLQESMNLPILRSFVLGCCQTSVRDFLFLIQCCLTVSRFKNIFWSRALEERQKPRNMLVVSVVRAI